MRRKLQDEPGFIGDSNLGPFFLQSTKVKSLGRGADGEVTLLRQSRTGRLIAAKLVNTKINPHWKKQAEENLRQEIKIFRYLGMHPNIIQAMGWDLEIPTVLLENANLGCLTDYQDSLHRHFHKFPEVSMWKVLSDMSKAIFYLHEQIRDPQLVHGDIKPANILVASPPGVKEFPLLPNFKLADFGRMSDYDPENLKQFEGTPEYAPPIDERRRGVTPAADIWGIGATLAELAFTITPNETDQQFLERQAAFPNRNFKVTEALLRKDKNVASKVRQLKEAMVRPLNATKKQQIEDLGIPEQFAVEPYSDQLQDWYELLCTYVPEDRVNAAVLHEYLVPSAEANVEVWAAKYNLNYAQHRSKIIAQNARAKSAKELVEVPPSRSRFTTDRHPTKVSDSQAPKVPGEQSSLASAQRELENFDFNLNNR